MKKTEMIFNFNVNDFGNAECLPEAMKKINPSLKLKMDALVKRVMQDMPLLTDKIASISINRTSEKVSVTIKSLNKGDSWSLENSNEIIALAQEIFSEGEALAWDDVTIQFPSKTSGKAAILPNITREIFPQTDTSLAHIGADKFAKDSELEGSPVRNSLEFICNFLNKRSVKSPPYGLSKELIQELTEAKVYDLALNDSQKISKMIKNSLYKKQPLLMSGGWEGNPHGHAIYYELLPGDNLKASLRLYNLGEGTDLFGSAIEGVKKKPVR